LEGASRYASFDSSTYGAISFYYAREVRVKRVQITQRLRENSSGGGER
jgi:hypothetical protein